MAIQFLDEGADDEFRVLRFPPRYDSQNTDLHPQVRPADAENGKKNSARNITFGIADFPAQMAYVVVAPIAVDGVHHCSAEAREPHPGKRKCTGRKIECHFRVEMARASPDQPEKSANH